MPKVRTKEVDHYTEMYSELLSAMNKLENVSYSLTFYTACFGKRSSDPSRIHKMHVDDLEYMVNKTKCALSKMEKVLEYMESEYDGREE